MKFVHGTSALRTDSASPGQKNTAGSTSPDTSDSDQLVSISFSRVQNDLASGAALDQAVDNAIEADHSLEEGINPLGSADEDSAFSTMTFSSIDTASTAIDSDPVELPSDMNANQADDSLLVTNIGTTDLVASAGVNVVDLNSTQAIQLATAAETDLKTRQQEDRNTYQLETLLEGDLHESQIRRWIQLFGAKPEGIEAASGTIKLDLLKIKLPQLRFLRRFAPETVLLCPVEDQFGTRYKLRAAGELSWAEIRSFKNNRDESGHLPIGRALQSDAKKAMAKDLTENRVPIWKRAIGWAARIASSRAFLPVLLVATIAAPSLSARVRSAGEKAVTDFI